ncbi:hypothetical protein LTR85_008449 [Meristemomyces frigidus]|nr:hypothetical protein LTR85_008449 [Meristemomyces frigidus]
MLTYNPLYTFWCALSLGLGAVSSPLESAVHIRTPPGSSADHVVRAIRREIAVAAVEKRDQDLKVNTTLDRSWDGAVLLSLGGAQKLGKTGISATEGVEIVCTTCYLKGVAIGELQITDNFNASQAIHNAIAVVEGTVDSITTEAETYFETYVEGVLGKLEDGIDLEDFELPTWPYNLTVPIPSIQKANLHLEFDGMELYMLIDTRLSLGATYTLNLFQSESLAGIAISDQLQLGVIFAVDLILTVDGMIDIGSGFHIRLDDGLAIDIALFDDEVNGGHFEFLPVTIESAGVVFSAVLRVGVHAGLDLVTPDFPMVDIDFGGGIEMGVYANVAEFVTDVRAQPEDQGCEIAVVQSYQLALGAAAGATIAVTDVDHTYTWGPVAQTSVPIWYTELDSACAGTKLASSATTTAMPNITARAEKRQDMTTTTLFSTVTYTGVNCISTGLVNCPVSLQNTSQSTSTSTLVTVVPSGSDASFPVSVQNAVPTTMTFGINAVQLPATSGSPVSYTPPPPTATATSTSIPGTLLHEVEHGVSKRVIIGVSIGVGVPVILALIGAIIFVQKKRKRSAAATKIEATAMLAEPYDSYGGQADYTDKPTKTGVNVTEMHRLSN